MPHRPNVLIVYPDQMRFDAMSCAGNPVLRTPNIDRLAAGGARFDHAYTSFPLCCPFRASVMTGKYAHSNGMHANHYPIDLDQTFLADLFAGAGYRTGYFGKWHLDGGLKHAFVPPKRRLGFQHFVGYNRGHEYFDPLFYRDDDPRPRTSRRYEPLMQTDHLIEFLTACGRDETPFMAMICYGPPHPPVVAPEEYLTRYRPEDAPVRANTPESARGNPRLGREFLAKYYGLVACVDDCLGRVLDWLDQTGLARDTIVYFVSDHGEMAGEHGLVGKKTCHEASMRVPLIVRWPAGIEAGPVRCDLVDPSVDTMPTLLELCGLPVPGAVQGVSFAAALRGEADGEREAVFYELLREREGPEKTPVARRGVRTSQWLYIRTEEAPEGLYHLPSDPLEMHDLAASPDHAAVVKRLDAMVVEHMARTGDDWAIEASFPPPGFRTHAQGRQDYLRDLERAIVED